MLDAAAAAVAAAAVVVAGCCWCRCGASRGGNVHAIIRRGKNERKKVEGWMRWTYPSSAFRSSFISLLLPRSLRITMRSLLSSPLRVLYSAGERERTSVAESRLRLRLSYM